jgi:rhodanese-related sulfurtransferase
MSATCHGAFALEQTGNRPAQASRRRRKLRVMNAPELDLAPQQVAELHRQGSVELVDVREPYEWEAGRVAGARHVELGRLDSLEPERPVVFYCRVGARSTLAARAFRRAGYEAYSMVGGLEAWHAGGLPLEPADGEVAEH